MQIGLSLSSTAPRGRARPPGRSGTAPGFAAPPALSGAATIHADLAPAPPQVAGDPAPVLSFQWRRDGVPIAGQTAAVYRVRPEDDLTALSLRVTATNEFGAAVAETGAVVARHAPPRSLPLPDRNLDRGSGLQIIRTEASFMGENLRFSINAVIGVTIDPQTGLVSVVTDDPMATTAVTVTAVNSGGSDSATFSLQVQEPPAFGTVPELLGSGLIGEALTLGPVSVSGTPVPVVSHEWRRNGETIPGATGMSYVLQPADDGADILCRVIAANQAGEAAVKSAPRTAIHAAPVATGDLADLSLIEGSGVQLVEAGAVFAGLGLGYSLTTAPEGASIDPATGRVSIATETVMAAAPVVVRAQNSGGAAERGFAVTVEAAAVPPVLSALVIDLESAPPSLSWSTDAAGTFFWRIDTQDTATDAEIAAGGGVAAGAFAVGAGVATNDIDLSTLAPGLWHLHAVLRDEAGLFSEVQSLAFEIEAVAESPWAAVEAFSGGTKTIVEVAGERYAVYRFTDPAGGSITFAKPGEVDYLIVGGGGAAGSRQRGSGGGAGGWVTKYVAGEDANTGPGPLEVTAGTHAITVGAGGSFVANGRGNPGGASAFAGIQAPGGGGGGTAAAGHREGGNGGNGGGACRGIISGGAGHPGFDGGDSSGGTCGAGAAGAGGTGGASDPDSHGGNGGPGLASAITGETGHYGGGGAGGGSSDLPGGTGGIGGGGNGGAVNGTGAPGVDGLGGGAGGSGAFGYNSPPGGAGAVVLRVKETKG